MSTVLNRSLYPPLLPLTILTDLFKSQPMIL